ncbi:unnamed protein product (macronuclear) [Paramecium tetraurelia]|uniref:Uncharacterized protein n=1 Tax=Paramecium tetraurelia TaxID=5888 RepID=A0EGM6_PARTE|nr:uncharacterized protein GSPATT00026791001 [Paramecium tetraurelia]CAK94467.1 unnamed protein product [Paramecium tetraurelia]|eukprot:XP_001461840.1 hypothetical protein (macronuclear) [Paramecium tetraurelia strain d4-2]
MVQTISGSQLSQTVATIEVVRRPLQKPFESSKVNQNGYEVINKIKELFSEAFFHHYAIILTTKENESMILHYLKEGFTSSIIQNQERQCYTVIERYESQQFKKLFKVKELYDLRQLNNQDSLKYDLLKNSCIHYVNHVKEYINQYLYDINEHAIQKIELPSLISSIKLLIQKIYQNIKKLSKKELWPEDLKKFTQENFKNPELYYQILYEAIRCGKNQSKMQMLGNSILIAVFHLINSIPIIGGILTLIAIPFSLYFIWIQSDEGIFQKCYKTLALFFIVCLGMLPETKILKYPFDIVSDLIKKYGIIKVERREIVIVGSCTFAGMIGGAAVAKFATPIIATACERVDIKSCILVITGLLSGGEPAAISSGAFLLEVGSGSAKAVIASASDAVISTSISVRSVIAKIGSINIGIAIGCVVGVAIGIGICKLLRWMKSG